MDAQHDPLQQFPIEAGDFAAAGEISARFKKLLKQLGIDGTIIRRAAIASYEAELNLVIHSLGGKMSLSVTPSEIIIVTEDIGPGIPNISMAMKQGYSTASDKARELGFGAGMGLPNIQRCADDIALTSEVGQGTRLQITIRIA